MRLKERNTIIDALYHSFVNYPTPSNILYYWNFGVFLLVFLIIQIITGIVLSMYYTPHIDLAFDSVEHIMRDVNYGWLLRYIHSNGASFFFIVVYIHIFRSLYIYLKELLWCSGVLILFISIFFEYFKYDLEIINFYYCQFIPIFSVLTRKIEQLSVYIPFRTKFVCASKSLNVEMPSKEELNLMKICIFRSINGNVFEKISNPKIVHQILSDLKNRDISGLHIQAAVKSDDGSLIAIGGNFTKSPNVLGVNSVKLQEVPIVEDKNHSNYSSEASQYVNVPVCHIIDTTLVKELLPISDSEIFKLQKYKDYLNDKQEQKKIITAFEDAKPGYIITLKDTDLYEQLNSAWFDKKKFLNGNNLFLLDFNFKISSRLEKEKENNYDVFGQD